jgi:hypothetical protein
MRRFSCLILLFAAVISACGGSDDEKNAAPEYATTPRKALESWVAAVREGDVEMMCRLLNATSGCDTPEKRSFVKAKLLPHVRAEMRGLTGDLHYGAINIGGSERRRVIGVVSGESPVAYAVPVTRGRTHGASARS